MKFYSLTGKETYAYMSNQEKLSTILKKLDNQNYRSYKQTKGTYSFDDFKLIIDHVQGDPFAAPSKFRIKIPITNAGFPEDTLLSKTRQIALRDFITREFASAAKSFSHHTGTGKGGQIAIDTPGQQILERSSCLVSKSEIEVHFVVGLPADGRRILGLAASKIVCEYLPKIVYKSLYFKNLNQKNLYRHILTYEDADYIRNKLKDKGLITFVANDSHLPRKSGIDDRPLDEDVIPFKSPTSFEVEFTCPNKGVIRGMGIPQGITVIVGGGYHGKSTLLNAIELGVYNHIPGDGREYVITDPYAMKIRAEDGRSIANVTISPFINNLPYNRSTQDFSTQNASGSTSQASNIIEAIEASAQVLLVDEDTSATNFMIRDHRMQTLITKEKEPITPFVDKVRQLYSDFNISTILVMGGSGDYFDISDYVIAMDQYIPVNVTEEAHEIAKKYQTGRKKEGGGSFGSILTRY